MTTPAAPIASAAASCLPVHVLPLTTTGVRSLASALARSTHVPTKSRSA